MKINFHGLRDCETGTLTRHPLLNDDLCTFSKNLKVINSHKQKMSEILTVIRDSHNCDCFALENDKEYLSRSHR